MQSNDEPVSAESTSIFRKVPGRLGRRKSRRSSNAKPFQPKKSWKERAHPRYWVEVIKVNMKPDKKVTKNPTVVQSIRAVIFASCKLRNFSLKMHEQLVRAQRLNGFHTRFCTIPSKTMDTHTDLDKWALHFVLDVETAHGSLAQFLSA